MILWISQTRKELGQSKCNQFMSRTGNPGQKIFYFCFLSCMLYSTMFLLMQIVSRFEILSGFVVHTNFLSNLKCFLHTSVCLMSDSRSVPSSETCSFVAFCQESVLFTVHTFYYPFLFY